MKTSTIVVLGAAAALGFYLWRRQQDTIVQKPATQLGTLATTLTGGVRLNGERIG